MPTPNSTAIPKETKSRTPDYDPMLQAFHAAFAPELRRVIGELPMAPNARVLDLCCGDGYYGKLLAERLNKSGKLVAADHSDAYLARARESLAPFAEKVTLEFAKVDAYALPFPDESFDVTWCAQSFISLEDPVQALKEMRRVVRLGGVVAILESDEYHHLLLPWPVELEMEVQQAVAESFREKYGKESKAAPARSLPRMLRRAGLKPRRKRTYAADRQPPFDEALRRFLELHLEFLRETVEGRLEGEQWERFLCLTDKESPEWLLAREDVDVTCLNVLFVGERARE